MAGPRLGGQLREFPRVQGQGERPGSYTLPPVLGGTYLKLIRGPPQYQALPPDRQMRLTGIIEGLRQFEWDDALVDGLNRARVGVINLSRLLEGGKLADNWGGAMLEEMSAMTGAGKSSDVAFFLADQDRLYQTYAFGSSTTPSTPRPRTGSSHRSDADRQR